MTLLLNLILAVSLTIPSLNANVNQTSEKNLNRPAETSTPGVIMHGVDVSDRDLDYVSTIS